MHGVTTSGRINLILFVLYLQLIQPRGTVVGHASDHANRRHAGILLCTAGLSVLADGQAAVAAAVPDCTFTKTPSGLSFCDTKEGSGDAAQPGTLVRVHYDGRLESNGSKFDSSYERGEHLFP
jgi:FKBP-type peptidyl-prolyl cis-trans isomerase